VAVDVIFALGREAAPFLRLAKRDRLPVRVSVSGMGRYAARSAAERTCAVEQPPQLVIAAGFCGALRPDLRVGDVVVESKGTGGRVLTVPRLVADPAEKRSLHAETGADVVDMESTAVAEVCAARGIPFLAVRAVSDTADTALSPRLAELIAGGSVSPWKAAWAVVRQPSLLGEFRRLARDTKLAAEKLASALRQIVLRGQSR
jgi:adenosylhomocysteine nucleosidase